MTEPRHSGLGGWSFALFPLVNAGAFNDPDMLEVGVRGTLLNAPGLPAAALTEEESSLHFSM